MLRLSDLKLKPDFADRDILSAAQRAGIPAGEITEVRLYKKSLDARDKGDVHYVVTALLSVRNESAYLGLKNVTEHIEPVYNIEISKEKHRHPVVIAGFGPCGLFAALMLARTGVKVIVLERGKAVAERVADNARFLRTGMLDLESNVQFGEGGAGTFSDGKLTTGVKDPFYRYVLNTLVEFGAPHEILFESKPHIGTDKLTAVVANIRKEILSLGGEVLFSHRLSDMEIREGRIFSVTAVSPDGSKVIRTDNLVLAIGHSARDTYELARARGLSMEQKPFSIGVRIEHLQSEISRSQYGKAAPLLPPADYKLACRIGDRGVYTFCNCPGGVVIPAATEAGGAVVNGMSYHDRNAVNANAALLVDVRTDDFGSADVLAGVEFQRRYERAAYLDGFRTKCQLVGDFLSRNKSSAPKSVIPSALRGYIMGEVTSSLPPFADDCIRKALPVLGGRLKGFDCPDGVLSAVETRSSAPVRIIRSGNFESNIGGIYPAGEGCGYAGGIISSALDGIRVARKIGGFENVR